MADLRLSDIDWNAAVAATGAFGGRGEGLSSGQAAQVLSLSALYTPDYTSAAARLRKAARLEPLNPLHTLRRVLLLARFGDTARAGVALDGLKQALPDSPLIDYVRGLLALRGGRPEQARAIANTLGATYPEFAYGKFLKADAQIVLASKLSAVEKVLMALPHGPQYDSLWADLLTKVMLLHLQGGPEQAEKYLGKKIRAGSPADTAVRRALAWVRASAEELEAHLERERPGSRAEELILSCLFERLERMGDNAKAAASIAALRRRHPERAALRRIQSTFVARVAVEKSGGGDYEHALRLVESCLREQPHDQINHQNRAALFTLLAESKPYFEAWSALNRHQYRLMLLGAADRFTVEQVARGHRLFAQQAQGTAIAGAAPAVQRGIFRRVPSPEGSDIKPIAVDADEIAADPELLRQWIHHARAELVFRHFLLGEDPQRFLLRPRERDESVARAEGLASCAESLSTLVPEEGALLARLLTARWRDAATRARTRYAAVGEDEEDEEVTQLRLQHLELLGGLALFCLQWQPGPQQLATAEEMLAFVRAEGSFFDEHILYRVQQRTEVETSYPVLVLADHVRRVTEAEKGAPLVPEQRDAVTQSLMAHLLRRMASSAYEATANSQKEQVNRALSYIERARDCNPNDASIELAAARFLVVGDFHDEAATALKRFQRLVAPDEHEELADAEHLEKILKERREKGYSETRRADAVEEPTQREGEYRIADLERELDRAPSSWRLYEEMVQELEKAGRFQEGVDWADRAVAHCLSRALQMNARALAIEARALQTLAEEHPRAARLYPLGARDPARKALESVAASRPLDYTLLFLLGRCELAAGSPEQAREAFGKAAACCERLLHRAVLRHLTDDIDNAYLAVARASVNSSLQDGSVDDAVREAAAVFTRLQEPAAWLVDFARVFYSAALARIGNAQSPPTVPRVACETPWLERLNAILSLSDEVERALAVAELALELHPPSRQQAQALCERIRTLKHQLAVTEALNATGRLLTERRFEEVLAMIERLEPPVAGEPRFLRLRVLALLGLGRFDEADRLMADADAATGLREFVSGYSSLVFRQRLTAAHRFLQDADVGGAQAVLEGATPTGDKEAAELAYCRAFALTMRARQLRRGRRDEEAAPLVLQALDLLEPHLRGADAGERSHMIELYDRLEKESEAYGRV
jgi:tetratricopeptide (TPR) repeat protein